jgi:hypothetical protein
MRYIDKITRTSPPDWRGSRIIAVPPARKVRQGNEMVDTCSPRPLARAHNQPSKGEKIKDIFLRSILCNLFAFRDTLDLPTKQTRITSVIYPPLAYQTEANKNKIKHHNNVFLNTKTWDLHPYASPEGPGSTPSEKYQRWPIVGPLGAAMRLTALRQTPKDISRHPTNFGHTKPILDYQHAYFPRLHWDYKPISTNTEKCGSA